MNVSILDMRYFSVNVREDLDTQYFSKKIFSKLPTKCSHERFKKNLQHQIRSSSVFIILHLKNCNIPSTKKSRMPADEKPKGRLTQTQSIWLQPHSLGLVKKCRFTLTEVDARILFSLPTFTVRLGISQSTTHNGDDDDETNLRKNIPEDFLLPLLPTLADFLLA